MCLGVCWVLGGGWGGVGWVCLGGFWGGVGGVVSFKRTGGDGGWVACENKP